MNTRREVEVQRTDLQQRERESEESNDNSNLDFLLSIRCCIFVCLFVCLFVCFFTERVLVHDWALEKPVNFVQNKSHTFLKFSRKNHSLYSTR